MAHERRRQRQREQHDPFTMHCARSLNGCFSSVLLTYMRRAIGGLLHRQLMQLKINQSSRH